jgi:2,3-bisphosphoglycerate-independent phosphoglycerate mutase
MKFVVFLGDGMADNKISSLGDKTPLDVAFKKNIDKYSNMGVLGMVNTVPDNFSPGSDVANLSVMGYDPNKYYTGRSPLEAASIGVTLKDNDTAFRANLVTLSGDGDYSSLIMDDYSADEISTMDAKILIDDFNETIKGDKTHLYSGVSYRHLLVLTDKKTYGNLTPPHDISKKPIFDYLPQDAQILDLMKKSYEFFENHPYNIKRIADGKKPASSIWIWGEGKRPEIDNFKSKFGVSGAVISAVDLIKGIGILSGLKSIDVEGATGNIHTNFEGKAQATIDALKSGLDFVYLHMEAPDECGHRFEIENKIKAIEYIDKRAFLPVMEYLENCGEDFAILVLPDHPTPVETGTHSKGAVPFFAYSNKFSKIGNAYTEENAEKTGISIEKGYTLMQKFLDLTIFL